MVTIQDPFNTPNQVNSTPPVPSKAIDMPSQARVLLLVNPLMDPAQATKNVKTSFVSDHEKINPDSKQATNSVFSLGRNTYSIKFVPLRSLTGAGGSSGSAPPKNALPPSNGLDDELPFLEH